jgi:hypothetical protein
LKDAIAEAGLADTFECVEAMMVDRTPEIATLLRQKPAAEGPIQGSRGGQGQAC